MQGTRFGVAILVLGLGLSGRSEAGLPGQSVRSEAATLSVNGDVATPQVLTLAEFKRLPRKKVEIRSESGAATVYEGVMVGDLLKAAGVSLGQMGPALASYVVATAPDGYRAVFAIAELDSAFSASEVLVADTVDGGPLPDKEGPLRLIAPKDLRPTRWVRALQRLDVVRLR